MSLNSFPLQFFFYDTATGMSQFILQQILGIIAGGLLNFILFAISFVVAESLTRKALPQHIQLWKTWDKNIASSKFVLKNTIMSYLIVPCFLAFVIFFFQAEDGIRDSSTSRGLGDVYKRQRQRRLRKG